MMTELSEYWNSFYSNPDRVLQFIPSQFASFVAGEALALGVETVIDMGCGSGRDTLFFAKYFSEVVGVDASESAIAGCVERAGGVAPAGRVGFVCEDIQSVSLEQSLASSCKGKRTLLYARFFLHAIDEDKQSAFLRLAQSLLADGGALALEFRTGRDAFLKKETPGHYRRYIETTDLLCELVEAGFKIRYHVEGFGYAKYKSDDAHVARLVCTFSG